MDVHNGPPIGFKSGQGANESNDQSSAIQLIGIARPFSSSRERFMGTHPERRKRIMAVANNSNALI